MLSKSSEKFIRDSCINNESYLKDWKLPPSSASNVFKRSGCSWFPSRSVNTVEKEIRLNKRSATFPLLCEHLKRAHQIGYNCVHFGMIQVGLKPTKLGSNTSAIIRICDLRMINIRESPLAMVESSLCDGPIYFTHFPSFIVPMSHSCDIFGIDVEIQGDEGITLMYRFHYKLIKKPFEYKINSSRCEERGKTTLFVVNLAQGKRVVSKTMYWDQIGTGQGACGEGDANIDWKETAKAHVVKVDVPGFKREEVKIEVEDGGILQISAERSNEQEEEESEKWHCKQRSSGIHRRLRLPESANLDEMKACMENGVLTVTVPKEEVRKKKPVKIIDITG